MSFFTIVSLVVFLAIAEGTSTEDPGVTLQCRCINKESRHIGRHIEKVELISANSHCPEIEIIATLKNNGAEVCLDPEAPWVQRVLKRILERTA
ncbi:interleukin-8-like [Limanda limanda]|uniref:interleukin-8-like n=1 Tax=Limanda limanda TaxID=27771 RepID=UPI0029C7A844|nr:interleukin-8-like [Limanda limanda]